MKVKKILGFVGEELWAMTICPGEEFTPASNEEDLKAVEGKVDSIKFTAVKPC